MQSSIILEDGVAEAGQLRGKTQSTKNIVLWCVRRRRLLDIGLPGLRLPIGVVGATTIGRWLRTAAIYALVFRRRSATTVSTSTIGAAGLRFASGGGGALIGVLRGGEPFPDSAFRRRLFVGLRV